MTDTKTASGRDANTTGRDFAATYTPDHCDGCGAPYAGMTGRMYSMMWRPEGADFELSYTLCGHCFPRLDTDPQMVSDAVTAAINRAPDWVVDWVKRHALATMYMPPAGHA